jgi:hypothetical protein
LAPVQSSYDEEDNDERYLGAIHHNAEHQFWNQVPREFGPICEHVDKDATTFWYLAILFLYLEWWLTYFSGIKIASTTYFSSLSRRASTVGRCSIALDKIRDEKKKDRFRRLLGVLLMFPAI